MIHLTANTHIQLAISPVDFRKGIDGLVALCEYTLQQKPRSGTLFVFINRNKTMIRILTYEQNGYWIMTKRLSKGRYQGWPVSQTEITPLQAYELRKLLSGVLSKGMVGEK